MMLHANRGLVYFGKKWLDNDIFSFIKVGRMIIHIYTVADIMNSDNITYNDISIRMDATNVDATISGVVTMNGFFNTDKLLLAVNHAVASIAIRNDHAIAAPKIPRYPTMSQRNRRNGTS